LAGAESFEAVAREWLAKQEAKMSPATFSKAIWTFEKLLFPWLGTQPVGKISPAELLATLRRTESRGRHETAHRAKQRASQVFRYAIATGRAERDPSVDLKGALHPVVSTPRAAITEPAKVAALLRAIHSYAGTFVTCCALKLAPMLFVRPGELRRAEWTEINFDSAEWRIPASKMKMREEHIVPLPTQALEILRELHPLTGRWRYVFPGVRSSARPMSENTITAALRNMGYDRQTMTGHGFRALASTRLNEMGWAPDVIERQLAHVERNKVRSVYNRAQYLKERRKMMQAWADYLEGLAKGANVVPIKAARTAK
jgi:integrase